MVMRSNHEGGPQNNDKVASMVDVVKQASIAKKKEGEEDVLVMDTKLKIIEILQVIISILIIEIVLLILLRFLMVHWLGCLIEV